MLIFQSRTESAGGDGESHQETKGSLQSSSSLPNDSTYINYEEEDDFVDETFETSDGVATTTAVTTTETESVGYSSGRVYPQRCIALYDFQVCTIQRKC